MAKTKAPEEPRKYYQHTAIKGHTGILKQCSEHEKFHDQLTSTLASQIFLQGFREGELISGIDIEKLAENAVEAANTCAGVFFSQEY